MTTVEGLGSPERPDPLQAAFTAEGAAAFGWTARPSPNPDALRNQIEGAIVQTLSRALYEEVQFDRARVTSVDWASYPILSCPETPALEVILIDRPQETLWGAGEAACVPVAAALGNAIFDATGVRLRRAPFTQARVRDAIASTPKFQRPTPDP